MEVDTGAAVTLISQATQKDLFPQAVLQKSTLTLHTYTAEPLGVVGQKSVGAMSKVALYIASYNNSHAVCKSIFTYLTLYTVSSPVVTAGDKKCA